LLNFIYLDEVFLKEEIALDLLELADEYSILELIKQCVESLLKRINVQNASRIIRLAQRAEIKELEQAAIDYLKNSFAKYLENLTPEQSADDFFKQT